MEPREVGFEAYESRRRRRGRSPRRVAPFQGLQVVDASPPAARARRVTGPEVREASGSLLLLPDEEVPHVDIHRVRKQLSALGIAPAMCGSESAAWRFSRSEGATLALHEHSRDEHLGLGLRGQVPGH
ncbi:MAG TPA: hypothetical protein VEU50_01045 [Archangium sp.]|nr:hypothetical protein [Archangium sp.]